MFYRFPNNAPVISKGDIVALKTCDVVSFHHVREQSFFNATKRESETNPFESTRRIDCNTMFDDYGSSGEKISPKDMKCFEMEHFPRVSAEWQTIIGCLKEGDLLTLYWQRDALRTEALQEAGFCGDKLTLIVTRGKKALHFVIDTYCGRNNTARMIQGPLKRDNDC